MSSEPRLSRHVESASAQVRKMPAYPSDPKANPTRALETVLPVIKAVRDGHLALVALDDVVERIELEPRFPVSAEPSLNPLREVLERVKIELRGTTAEGGDAEAIIDQALAAESAEPSYEWRAVRGDERRHPQPTREQAIECGTDRFDGEPFGVERRTVAVGPWTHVERVPCDDEGQRDG